MTSPTTLAAAPTTSRILDVAERLAQTRGFNGFSYADIACEVGITKASLHYHFATKAELGRRLIERYSGGFQDALNRITRDRHNPQTRLHAYVKIYAEVLAEKRMCLCGMLAAEYATLPEPMQHALRTFFAINEGWVARLLEDGQREGCFALQGQATEAASMLLSALEGAMLVARASADSTKFDSAARLLLSQLEAAPGAPAQVRTLRPRAPSSRPGSQGAVRARRSRRS